MSEYEVVCADVLAWAAEYDGPKFHALLCDAPYELGFMGKTWDGSGVSFQPETWAALAEHLHPGAFGMTFAGSRTWHRIAVAIEDAGLVIHPSIFAWANGQGFPKATRIDTQVDKAAIVACPDCHATGKTRNPEAQEWEDYWLDEPCQRCGGTGKVKGAEQQQVWYKRNGGPGGKSDHIGQISADRPSGLGMTTLPATPLAAAWQGHRYGLQALKPAVEPIIVFQKPYEGKPVECITATGAGALWVDGGRIGTSKAIPASESQSDGQDGIYSNGIGPGSGSGTGFNPGIGRWPANFALVHAGPRECPNCQGKGVIFEPDGTFVSLCEQCETEDGPGALYGGALETCPEGHPITEVNEQRFPVPCTVCGTWGTLPGCERIGTRQVRGDKRPPGGSGGIWSGESNVPVTGGYADADGLETVAAYRCTDECPVRRLGEQSGVRKSGGPVKGTEPSATTDAIYGSYQQRAAHHNHNDTGTCARFFFNADWSAEVAEQLAAADPVRYQAKAGRKERDAGLDEWALQSGTIGHKRCAKCGRQAVNVSGTCQCDMPEWIVGTSVIKARNPHPTVKPIALVRWLTTLLLPPAEYAPRRILVPFAGSGSEMVGCGLAGWEEIVGVELMQEYVDICEARLAHWLAEPQQLELPIP